MASNHSVRKRTVVFTLPKGSSVTCKDFVPALRCVQDKITAFGTVGAGNIWHLTLKNVRDVQVVLDLGNFHIADNILVQTSRLIDVVFTGILHWLPFWVPHEDVCHSMEKLLIGKITCKCYNIQQRGFKGCMSTQRKIESTVSMKSLPYFIGIESNGSIYQTFLFVPGRRPICFSCGLIGHKKAECSQMDGEEERIWDKNWDDWYNLSVNNDTEDIIVAK